MQVTWVGECICMHSGRWIGCGSSQLNLKCLKEGWMIFYTGFHREKRTTYIDPSSSWCLRISGTSSQVYNTLNTRPGGSGRKPSGPAWYRLLVFLVKRRYLERLFKSILKIAWYASYWSNLKCPFDPRVEVRIMVVRKRSQNSKVWLGNIWF